MLVKDFRLTNQKEFERVYKSSRPIWGRYISIRSSQNQKGQTRFGFVISNKTVPKATARNRAKRQFRAIINDWLGKIKTGYDVIIVLKQLPVRNEHESLSRDLNFLLRKTNLLKHNKK